MKRGIYITTFGNALSVGVEKKIRDQVKVFKTFFEVEHVNIPKCSSKLRKIVSVLPGGSISREYRQFWDKYRGIKFDYIYIRKVEVDRAYLKFIMQLRELNPKAKIVLEFPTYPYDKDLKNSRTMWPWYYKDKYNRNSLTKYVDRIVTFSEDDEIFGIPTLKISNGIDVGAVKMASVFECQDNRIKMIAVAMMQQYHGFERLIKGLYSYYRSGQTRNIELVLVGYGPELDSYKDLTRRYKLEDRVCFMGKLQGEELDRVYDGCDLAIGSMGGYKIGIYMFSSIKLGEYLAKGLPVVTGGKTMVFEKFGNEFNLDFPNDESEIDIKKVVEFYDYIYGKGNKTAIREKVREFARETIDIYSTMKPVVEYLEP